ncbi:MAG: magnesium citrate secondary transporter [Flavobacteriales bacterium]|nr:magnesium citrate secondary transporter [Flavobacteriales bacterium]
MKQTLSNPIFLVAVALAATNQLLEKAFGIFVPIIHSYLDDLLCFPIVLTLGLAMYRYFIPNYRLTAWHIWPILIIYSVYFEWYLPRTSNAYTSDVLDVLMYVLGAVMFNLTINSEISFRRTPSLNSPSL